MIGNRLIYNIVVLYLASSRGMRSIIKCVVYCYYLLYNIIAVTTCHFLLVRRRGVGKRPDKTSREVARDAAVTETRFNNAPRGIYKKNKKTKEEKSVKFTSARPCVLYSGKMCPTCLRALE